MGDKISICLGSLRTYTLHIMSVNSSYLCMQFSLNNRRSPFFVMKSQGIIRRLALGLWGAPVSSACDFGGARGQGIERIRETAGVRGQENGLTVHSMTSAGCTVTAFRVRPPSWRSKVSPSPIFSHPQCPLLPYHRR